MNRCGVEGCKRKYYAKGWCALHYQRWYKHGDPELILKATPSNRLERGEAAKRKVLKGYKRSAQQRGYEWQITDEQAEALFQSECHYCGAPPLTTTNWETTYGQYTYNGIDRAINEIGYIESNCVPCCKYCNLMKGQMSEVDFIAKCVKIVDRTKVK